MANNRKGRSSWYGEVQRLIQLAFELVKLTDLIRRLF
jgi:hypothetical protein